jgi:hypothetical protein
MDESMYVNEVTAENPSAPVQTNIDDAASGVRADWRYVAYHRALILAMPFLLLAVNGNMFINSKTNQSIDSWVYTGFFLSLPDHLERWGGTYYATRLSWLLPGFAAHQLFSPVLANYVLHIAFYYALLFAVYSLVTAGVNRTTAFVVTLLVAWNPGVLASISWDYVDGAVITYFAVTLLCLEKASFSRTHMWHWAVAAGAGLACMACANVTATTLWPICCLFLFLRVGVVRWRTTLSILAVAAVGAVVMVATFGLANRLLGGQWLFLMPSVAYAGSRMWLQSPWDVPGTAWLADAPFLVLPAAAAVGALLALSRWSRIAGSFAGTIQLTFLVAASWWVVHSALWTHSIHVSYYTSYLTPLGLLAFAIQPGSPLTGAAPLRLRRTIALELTILGVLIVAHLLVFRQGEYGWTAAANALAAAFPTAYRFNAVVAFAVCSLAIAWLAFVPASRFRWPVFLLSFWIAYGGTVPTNWPTAHEPRLREDFALTASVHRFIGQHLDRKRPLRMWYMLPGGTGRPFRNISSTYLWGWILVNEEMPSLAVAQAASLVPDTQLVLLVADRRETDEARQALGKFGLDYVPEVQQQFGPRDSPFWVAMGTIRVTR